MNSANKAVGPISMALLVVGFVVTLAMTMFMPAAELLPAQVLPAPRASAESPVRQIPGMPELMNEFGKMGLKILSVLPRQEMAGSQAELEKEATQVPDKSKIMETWEAKIVKENGPDYGQQIIKNLEGSFGRDNVESIVQMVQTDKNFCYYAYGLFLGLAMFAAAVAIQAIGRYESEEKTIIPVKK